MLDTANTSAYGHPVPTEVTLKVEQGPFIVISGHDLHDLKKLLEQTEGRGINIYTHGEMLPAHAYPELKKYSHMKGNFGTAWQNQQKEFASIPAPVLFTVCGLMVQFSHCRALRYSIAKILLGDSKVLASSPKNSRKVISVNSA